MFQHTVIFLLAIMTMGGCITTLYTISAPFYFILQKLFGMWPGNTPRSSQIGSILHKISGELVLWFSGVKVSIGPDSAKRLAGFANQNVVFVFNHTSNTDPFILSTALPANVRFVYKKELQYVPFLGCGLVAAGHIAVDRGARDKAINSLHRAEAQLKKDIYNGGSFALAPEGTRSKDGKLITPFKKGPFHVAKNTGTKIVPLLIRGAHEIFAPGSMRFRPGVVQVRCLDAVDSKDFEDADKLREKVEAMMVEGSDPRTWREPLPKDDEQLPFTASPLFALAVLAGGIALIVWFFLFRT